MLRSTKTSQKWRIKYQRKTALPFVNIFDGELMDFCSIYICGRYTNQPKGWDWFSETLYGVRQHSWIQGDSQSTAEFILLRRYALVWEMYLFHLVWEGCYWIFLNPVLPCICTVIILRLFPPSPRLRICQIIWYRNKIDGMVSFHVSWYTNGDIFILGAFYIF